MSGPTDGAPVIRVDGVTKTYHLRQERSNLRGLIPGRLGELTGEDTFDALCDVSFEVRPGEALGIIGHNGAGKSTMLKVLAGIIEPSRGTVEVRGKVSALIELGAAFEENLTGAENIDFAAGLLGLRKAEIRARFDEIVEFAGLEAFIGMPVKRYSTGMRARLGFAVATCIQPEVLIVDEVLSVGDFAFQRKSLERIRAVHEAGAALVIVSHSPWLIEQLCPRLLLLDHGTLAMDGDAPSVLARYHGPEHQAETDPTVQAPQFVSYAIPDGPAAVTIDDIWTVPAAIEPGDPLEVRARITVREPVDGILVMAFYTSGRAVFAEREPGPVDFLREPGTWTVGARMASIPIATGNYFFRFAVLPEDSNDPDQTFHEALASREVALDIRGPVSARPGVYLDTEWTTERSADAPPPIARAPRPRVSP